MSVQSLQAGKELIQSMLQPMQKALAGPAQAQEQVLQDLLKIYAQTEYGRKYGADQVGSSAEYRQRFPVATYEDYQAHIRRVMQGDVQAMLNEPPVGWAITRGTTKGETKFIPMTPTDLRMRVAAGRAMLNYVITTGRFDLLDGVNLNLNFPSVVGKIKAGDRELEYGYSSGIYTRYVARTTPIQSLPTQDDIDARGGGKTIRDWEARFELAYQKCMHQNVTLVGGVAPTAVDFGRYINQAYKVYPKDIWKIQVMTLGSVPGINTRVAPALKAMYGKAAIREIYGATEGMFGQQMDDKRAWMPNYDLFFFEIQTPFGIKMMHEMRPGEIGNLVVSTPVLARYRIGDLIRAIKPPYFRCIGRDKWWTPLRYIWDEFSTFNLGRL
jgi:hypothetical protein